MSQFNLGEIIRNRRLELNIDKAELAQDICAVETLARIENGQRLPSRVHFEMLTQRLGMTRQLPLLLGNEQDWAFYDKKSQFQLAIRTRNLPWAGRLLCDMEDMLEDGVSTDRQLVMAHRVILYPNAYQAEERLRLLEEALRLTCHSYSADRLPGLMSQDEIVVLNAIAMTYADLGQWNTAMDIWAHICNYYDRGILGEDDTWLSRPLVYRNLSGALLMQGRLEECAHWCQKAIENALFTAHSEHLSGIYATYAAALRPSDPALAKKYAVKACCMAYGVEHDRFPRRLAEYQEQYGREFDFLGEEAQEDGGNV